MGFGADSSLPAATESRAKAGASKSVSGQLRVLWAKSEPFHPLWKHLLDAAAVSLSWRNPLSADGFDEVATAWLVAIHDVGKADSTFQAKSAALVPALEAVGFKFQALDDVRHERISAAVLERILQNAKVDRFMVDAATSAIAAHHGHWCGKGRTSGASFEAAQSALVELLDNVIGAPKWPSERARNVSAFGMRLAGHMVFCDWIASNERYFDRDELRSEDDPIEYFARSREVAREMIATLGLVPDTDSGHPFEVVSNPRPLQSMLLDANLEPGLVVIEAPMGEGKTEAAWILAEQWREHGYRGAYMALPTQATGDAIFERYERDYLGRLRPTGKVHLVHGMAWLRDVREPERRVATAGEVADRWFADQWFRPTRRAMVAAHGAGTVDQFLLAGMCVKFGFLRLYGLDRRVLIVDEVHAYDAYMTAILCRGLQWCASMRIPVVLLSATLSADQRRKLMAAYGASDATGETDAPYPLVTHVGFDGRVFKLAPCATSSRQLELVPHAGLLGDSKATANLALSLATEGKCVCVIVNTVRQAQAVYKALDLPTSQKGLFHARFKIADRERIAGEVIERFGKDRAFRPDRYVLVATQVVEQSLDVDFDEMISEIAPIDLLLQRSGRLHRHFQRPDAARLHVLLPSQADLRFGGTERVYGRYPLLRTLALVSTGRQVSLPTDFRELIEAVYGDAPIPERIVAKADLLASHAQWESDVVEMESAAEPYLLNPPRVRDYRPVPNLPTGDDSDDGDGWRGKTRLGASDKTALPIDARELARLVEGRLPMNEVRQLYRSALRIPSYVPLDQPGEGYTAAVRANRKLRGLLLLPLGDGGDWQGGGYRLRYDLELGLEVNRT